MLKQILATKEQEIKELYSKRQEIEASAKQCGIPRYSFLEALKNPKRRSALIAEVKKASPSKGVIRPNFNPVQIAREYEQAGVDALSVLTDITYFQGDGQFIRQIKEHVALPVLRKEFILDPLQVIESVALGADAILLIAKALPADQLYSLYKEAEGLGLDCLVEVASIHELEMVLNYFTPPIIGVNNRDLATFTTSIERTKELLPHIPEGVVLISESGINSPDVVAQLTDLGVGGFLVGEFFMRQSDLVQAVQYLYGAD
jgi:indole-3-glycerol phosphate synthase